MSVIEPEFRRIAEATAPGVRAQIRLSPRHSTEVMTWTAPVDILTLRCAPAATVSSRSSRVSGQDFMLDGLLTFRPRSMTWDSHSDGAPQMSLVVRFEKPLKYPNIESLSPLNIDDFSVQSLMNILLEEVREPGFSSAALIESVSTALRVKLRRIMQRDKISQERSFQMSDRNFDLVREYISANIHQVITITELSDLCGVSQKTLLRIFKSKTGATVSEYIAQVQLQKAKYLLARSSMLVKQVAFEVGFRDPNNFCTAFRRLTGLTPQQFRKTATS